MTKATPRAPGKQWIAWSHKTHMLEVKYKNGTIAYFADVDEQTKRDLWDTKRPGRFIETIIRKRFTEVDVAGTPVTTGNTPKENTQQ